MSRITRTSGIARTYVNALESTPGSEDPETARMRRHHERMIENAARKAERRARWAATHPEQAQQVAEDAA